MLRLSYNSEFSSDSTLFFIQAMESDPGMLGGSDRKGHILIMLEGLDEAEGETPLDNKVGVGTEGVMPREVTDCTSPCICRFWSC